MFVKNAEKLESKLHFYLKIFGGKLKKSYLCTRKTGNTPVKHQKKEFFERIT